VKKKIIIGVAIFLLISFTFGVTIYRNSKPTFKTVTGISATSGSISEQVFASGRLELGDKTDVDPPFSGKVKSVSVKLGVVVNAGQTLFEMDTADLEKQISAAKLSLADAKASLDSAKLTQAYSLEDAKQAVDAAQQAFDAAAGIPDGALGPDGKPVNRAALQAAYENAKKTYNRLVSNPGGGQMSITSLENAVKRADANLKELQAQVNSAVVKVPISGTVVAISAVAGSSSSGAGIGLSSGTSIDLSSSGSASALVTVGNLDKLKARVKVNEMDSTKVKVGQKVKITADTSDKEFGGSVESVSPVAVTSGGTRGDETTVEVMVALDNCVGLKPGYNVNVAIMTNERNGVVLVPSDAVTDRQGKQVVFVVENGEVKQREVNIGLEGETQVEVKLGIKDGETVLLSPDPTLKEGDKVKVNE